MGVVREGSSSILKILFFFFPVCRAVYPSVLPRSMTAAVLWVLVVYNFLCALFMQFPSVTENFIKICKGVVPYYLFPSYHIIQ